MKTGRTALYRHWNADGELLYVGISLNAVSRLAQHRVEANWFDDIARIDIEWHPDRSSADAAERAAIKAEHPLHNIAHVSMSPALVAMLRKVGGLHMVDPNGVLLDEYASLTADEASELADRL